MGKKTSHNSSLTSCSSLDSEPDSKPVQTLDIRQPNGSIAHSKEESINIELPDLNRAADDAMKKISQESSQEVSEKIKSIPAGYNVIDDEAEHHDAQDSISDKAPSPPSKPP